MVVVVVVATHLCLPIFGVEDQDEAKAVDQDVPTANQGNPPTAETTITLDHFRAGIEEIEQKVEMVL